MSEYLFSSKPKSMQLEATITRADGTVEKLGVIDYWDRNVFKFLAWRIKKWLHF